MHNNSTIQYIKSHPNSTYKIPINHHFECCKRTYVPDIALWSLAVVAGSRDLSKRVLVAGSSDDTERHVSPSVNRQGSTMKKNNRMYGIIKQKTKQSTYLRRGAWHTQYCNYSIKNHIIKLARSR